MSKKSRLILSVALVTLISVLSLVSGCQRTASEYSLDIVEQAWEFIFDDYVDREKLVAGDVGYAATENMLESLDDPDTSYVEGEPYRLIVSQLDVEGLRLIEETWDIITEQNAGDINLEDLKRAAIEGMLESLDDPYSSYMAAEQFEYGTSQLEGEFNGIGVYITVEDKKLVVIAPITDSPADKAGIMAGDIILEVNDEPISEMSMMEAIVKIRGIEGTTVKLLILHEGETEPEVIEVVRTRVKVPSVRFEMKGEVAYINITEFTKRTGEELDVVMANLEEAGARGIILDLRGNPGGLLETVIEVVSRFLDEGTVVKMRDNRGKVTPLNVITGTPTTDLPAVVLVNKASASGSEVLAGALQDHGRATIAGTRTFGKGSVNILRQLDDGSGLYITTARWLTPDGHLIEGGGIAPDYPLELTGEDAIQWAVDYLTSGK